MRSTLQVILAILLAAVFVAPVAAAGPGGAGQETVSGILEAVHVDEFATGREREDYSLRTSHGVIPLEFADGGPDGYGGATVTVTGTRSGKTLRIAELARHRELPGHPQADAGHHRDRPGGDGHRLLGRARPSRPPAWSRPPPPAPWPRTSLSS